MKIEDIKPDDVIVRTEDKILFKVVEVTPDRQIMQSANGKMNEVFCIFQEPQPMVLCSMDDYEPATEEQREYMESKLAAFNGTNPEVESKRITALASIMGDLKQENIELAERVKELMSDYNNVVKQPHPQPVLSELTEVLDKVKHLKRDKDFLRREIELLQDHNTMLRKQLNNDRTNAEEKLAKHLEDYYALRDCNEVVESRIARFENADIEHADFSTMALDCPHGVEAKVCSAECLGCEHCLTHGNTGTRSILCAYNYDKKKEKEQEIDKLQRAMIRELNS